MDRVTPEKRSGIMARVRSENTGAELVVRRLVHSMGYRYRLHRKDLPGRPDLVFVGRRKVIFVNGCFWHQHPQCSFARKPKSREDYWLQKFENNCARDVRNREELILAGWKVLTVWECELGNVERVREIIRGFLNE